jgi:hypothetical protein
MPQITIPINNPNAAATATTVPTFQTYTWDVWIPQPSNIHYHYCQHEEVNKHLIELINKLVDRIVELEKQKK